MKKLLAVSFGVMAVTVLSGCSLSGSKSTSSTEPAPVAIPATSPELSGPTTAPQADNNLVRQLASGKKLKCSYAISTPPSVNIPPATVTMYIDGKNVRTETTSGGTLHTSVSDGTNLYAWESNTKVGTRLNFDCLKETIPPTAPTDSAQAPLPTPPTGPSTPQSPEETLKSIPNASCEETASVDVTVPSDIAFTDQCEMLRNQAQIMKNIPKGPTTPPVQGLPGSSK